MFRGGWHMKSQAILCSALFFVMLSVLAAGTEGNVASYWIEQGNTQFNQGDSKEAINCYNKAIELGDQANAPTFSAITTQCGYRMDAVDKNNPTQVFSKIYAEPTSTEGLTLIFDVSNPNSVHMGISNISVEVIKYTPIINCKIIQNFGQTYSQGYFCNIEPERRSYECDLTSKDYDHIDLAPNKSVHVAININTDRPGAYGLRIRLGYIIDRETKGIIVGDVPETIGFFDNSLLDEAAP
jgi:tetratricopeptide (TPR) repeat protein